MFLSVACLSQLTDHSYVFMPHGVQGSAEPRHQRNLTGPSPHQQKSKRGRGWLCETNMTLGCVRMWVAPLGCTRTVHLSRLSALCIWASTPDAMPPDQKVQRVAGQMLHLAVNVGCPAIISHSVIISSNAQVHTWSPCVQN